MSAPKLSVRSNDREEWRVVSGTKGLYSVSDQGRVRRNLKTRPPRVLKPSTDKDGYLRVGLSVHGELRTRNVHRLVCEAFHGPSSLAKPLALHWDDNKTNNTPENLRWGSASDNQRDSVRNGIHWESRRDRCIRDHPFDEANTYFDQHGKRSCKTCRRDAMNLHVRNAKFRGLTPDDPRHGTTTGYGNYGCRCDPCRDARKKYKKTWREARNVKS